MAAWIRIIAEAEAEETLRQAFDSARTPHGTVDNVMRVHSLRPHTMEGHLALYRSVLHHPETVLPLWFLEVVASYVSVVNNCNYSLKHHFANAARLMDDEERAKQVRTALTSRAPEAAFDGKELALLRYAEKLTVWVGVMVEEDIAALRNTGCDDGEILEVNQVVAYFNYSNRVLNGLGVSLDGDTVGYYAGGLGDD